MKIKLIKIVSLVAALVLMITCLSSCESSYYIDSVKYGSPNDYPDMTWGDQLDAVCSDGEWTEFEIDGMCIVEYNGTVDETDSEICIQFEVFEEDDSFEIYYMDIDGEECSTYEVSEVVDILFAE